MGGNITGAPLSTFSPQSSGTRPATASSVISAPVVESSPLIDGTRRFAIISLGRPSEPAAGLKGTRGIEGDPVHKVEE
jgi:hypothetical protein